MLRVTTSLDDVDVDLDGCPQEVRDVTEEYLVKIANYKTKQEVHLKNEVAKYDVFSR